MRKWKPGEAVRLARPEDDDEAALRGDVMPYDRRGRLIVYWWSVSEAGIYENDDAVVREDRESN